MKQVLDDNKIVIFGIVLPTVLLLRFPVLLPIAARVGITGGASVLRALIQTVSFESDEYMLFKLSVFLSICSSRLFVSFRAVGSR